MVERVYSFIVDPVRDSVVAKEGKGRIRLTLALLRVLASKMY